MTYLFAVFALSLGVKLEAEIINNNYLVYETDYIITMIF